MWEKKLNVGAGGRAGDENAADGRSGVLRQFGPRSFSRYWYQLALLSFGPFRGAEGGGSRTETDAKRTRVFRAGAKTTTASALLPVEGGAPAFEKMQTLLADDDIESVGL